MPPLPASRESKNNASAPTGEGGHRHAESSPDPEARIAASALRGGPTSSSADGPELRQHQEQALARRLDGTLCVVEGRGHSYAESPAPDSTSVGAGSGGLPPSASSSSSATTWPSPTTADRGSWAVRAPPAQQARAPPTRQTGVAPPTQQFRAPPTQPPRQSPTKSSGAPPTQPPRLHPAAAIRQGWHSSTDTRGNLAGCVVRLARHGFIDFNRDLTKGGADGGLDVQTQTT